MFSKAADRGIPAKDWVNELKDKNELIMGIGHRVKSANNPDKRVQLVVEAAKKNFPATPVLDFALEVEKITTKKKANLILNVRRGGGLRLCGPHARLRLVHARGGRRGRGAGHAQRAVCHLAAPLALWATTLDQVRLKQGPVPPPP